MTDTFANGPSAPGNAAARQAGGDVTGTLAELERKLRELERELTSIGRSRELGGGPTAEPSAASTPAGQGAGRLVDEAIEPPAPASAAPSAPPASFAAPPNLPARPTPPPPGGAPAPNPSAPPTPFAPAAPHLSTPPAPSAAPAPHQPTPPPGAAPTPYPPTAAPSSPGASAPASPSEQPGSGQPVKFVRPAAQERMRPSEAQLAGLAELRRFRDRLERFARDLAAEYDALLSRVMAGLTAPASTPGPSSTPAATVAGGSAAVPPGQPATPSATRTTIEDTMFEGRVELGVGPFYDLASLSAFERRLASLPHVSEASVRRFEASHAVVDLRLAAPVALVRELRRSAESDFNVREVAEGRILLTFDDG